MKQLIGKALLKLTVVFFFISITYQSQASTIFANGPIPFSTVWSADTVFVIGDITVNTGVILTINPGTHVIFNGHYKLNVDGCLRAVGNSNAMIYFTISDTTGFSNISSNNGGWYGIRFNNNTSTDTSKLVYCNLSYGKANGSTDDANGGALFIYNSSKIIVSNCTFDHNMAKTNGGGIYIRKSTARILFNQLTNNKCSSGGGIYISSGAPSVYNNTFISNYASNGGGGIFCTDTTLAKINGNLIRHNLGLLGAGVGCFNASPTFFLIQALQLLLI